MNQNTPNNPFAGNNQGQEGAQMNEHSSGGGMASNAYFANQQNTAVPDLDAGAPVLKSNEQQRLNRKALFFLAGIVVMLLLAILWIARGVGFGSKEAPKPRQQQLAEVPVMPQEVAELPPPVPAAEPIALASVVPPPATPDDFPMPAVSPPPSRAERRVIADVDTPMGPVAPAAAPALEQGVATSAQFIRNPDAMMLRGTYIRCVLETHIVTDVPGFTSCIVTEPVYSLNGRNLLLPKGSKVYGQYNMGAPNTPRVSVIWDRVTTPTGVDVTMASPGVDNLGGAGHPGDFNAHWGSRITSALLISMLSDGFKYAAAEHGPNTSTVTSSGLIVDQPFESNTARTMERLANDALERTGSRPATVTINQGTVVNVYVAKDIDFSAVLRR